MNKHIFRILAAILAFSFLLAACSPATPTPDVSEPTEEVSQPAETEESQPAETEETQPVETEENAPPAALKAISVQMGANDPRSIDPQRAIDSRDWALLNHLFPSLINMDIDSKSYEAGIAMDYQVSEDGLVYTFNLIEEVPWVRYNDASGQVEQVMDDSGSPRFVTASDFVYGFLRALDPETGSPAAYILAPYITGAAEYNAGNGAGEDVGVKAVSDYTFEITAPEKVGFALGIYSIINARAVPEWAITESEDAWTEPENIASYGPFALKSWEHEASMTMVKNPFWQGSEGVTQPKLDEVTFRFIDEITGLREFEAGTIDMTLVPGDQLARLQADANLSAQLDLIPGLCTQAWGFNTTKTPLDNAHIRRALTFAVDRQSLVDNVLGGGQVPAVFFTPPGVALAPAGTDAASTPLFDLEKAQEELQLGLEELGLASAADLPVISVEFGTSQELSAVAQALQAMWQENLDVQIELAQIDNTVYWAKQEEDAGPVFRAGWCPDYNDANNYLLDVYRSDSIYNYGKWTNSTFDELIDEARTETDPAVRLDLYTQAEQLLNVDDAGTMSLYYPVRAQLTNPAITRTFSPSGTEYFWEWDVE